MESTDHQSLNTSIKHKADLLGDLDYCSNLAAKAFLGRVGLYIGVAKPFLASLLFLNKLKQTYQARLRQGRLALVLVC